MLGVVNTYGCINRSEEVSKMPAKKLPPTAWIMAGRDEGMQWEDIRDLAMKEWGVPYATTAAYALAHLRAGGATKQPRYIDQIPWVLAAEHHQAYDAQMLRFAGRRAHGNPLSARDLRLLEAWERKLRDNNAVVHYTRETGFVWVEPRPGIDTGLIRVPDRVERGTVLDPGPAGQRVNS